MTDEQMQNLLCLIVNVRQRLVTAVDAGAAWCGDALLLRPRVDGAEAVHFLPAVVGPLRARCRVAKAMALLLVSSEAYADNSCRTSYRIQLDEGLACC